MPTLELQQVRPSVFEYRTISCQLVDVKKQLALLAGLHKAQDLPSFNRAAWERGASKERRTL